MTSPYTIIVGDCKISLSSVGRSSEQKINKENFQLHYTYINISNKLNQNIYIYIYDMYVNM